MSALRGVFELEELVAAVICALGPIQSLQLRAVQHASAALVSDRLLLKVAEGWSSSLAGVSQKGSLSEWIRTSPKITDAIPCAILAASSHGHSVSEPNAHGQTPLMWAAGRGHAPLCALLVTCSANLDAVDSGGWTALFRAAWHGKESCVAVLLRANADMETKTARYTPLMAAARFGHAPVVRQLLVAKADASATTVFGETALSLAHDQRHEAAIRLLQGSTLGVCLGGCCSRHARSDRKEAWKFEVALGGVGSLAS